MPKKITEEIYDNIHMLIEDNYGLNKICDMYEISEKTALQIFGSPTYTIYKMNVDAQHPAVKRSLRDRVLKLHRTMFSGNDGYIEPTSAWTAMYDIERFCTVQTVEPRILVVEPGGTVEFKVDKPYENINNHPFLKGLMGKTIIKENIFGKHKWTIEEKLDNLTDHGFFDRVELRKSDEEKSHEKM